MKSQIFSISVLVCIAAGIVQAADSKPVELTVGKPVPVNRKIFGFITATAPDQRLLKQLGASSVKMEAARTKVCMIVPLTRNPIPSIILKRHRKTRPGVKIRAVIEDPAKSIRNTPMHAFHTVGMIIDAIAYNDVIGEVFFDFKKSQALRKTADGNWEAGCVVQVFSEIASFSVDAKSMHTVSMKGNFKDLKAAAFSCNDRTRMILLNYGKAEKPVEISSVPRSMGALAAIYRAGTEHKAEWKKVHSGGKTITGPLKSEKTAVTSGEGKPMKLTLPAESLTILTIDTPGSM